MSCTDKLNKRNGYCVQSSTGIDRVEQDGIDSSSKIYDLDDDIELFILKMFIFFVFFCSCKPFFIFIGCPMYTVSVEK